jgi:hypothetical protein
MRHTDILPLRLIIKYTVGSKNRLGSIDPDKVTVYGIFGQKAFI